MESSSQRFTDWIIDGLIRILITMFIPFSLPQEIIIELKGTFLSILINLFLILLLVTISIFGVVALPFFLSKYPSQSLAASVSIEGGFTPTDIPDQNPLGGPGLDWVYITAYFHDPSYFQQFHIEHEGVDFVPNSMYYQVSPVWQKEKPDVIIFATNNGTVNYFVDQYGSNSVLDTNPEGSLQTEYLHLNKVFVHTGETVKAGTPIGTMGDTGYATGEHLHYQVNVHDNGIWIPTDPLMYIR